MTSSTG